MTTRCSRALAALVVSLLICSASRAEDPSEEVVVTATRSGQRIKQTMQHTTVITEHDIRASQAIDVPTLLRKEAGVQIAQNGGVGHTSSMFVRGAATNQTLILVDGVRVNSVTSGTTQLDQLMLDDIERIEVVRGPGSSLYGSDAIGGVVQIFTRRGRGAPAATAIVGIGTDNTQRYGIGYGGEFGGLQISANASAFRTDGFSAVRPEASPTVNPDDDGYRNYSGSAAATYHFNDRNSAGITYLASQGRAQFDNVFAVARDDRQLGKTRLTSGSAFLRNQLTDVWTSRISTSEGTDLFRNLLNERQTDFFETKNQLLTWQNDLAIATGHQAVLGAETLEQQVHSTVRYTRDRRRVNSIFGGYAATFGAHTLQGNVRNDHYSDLGAKMTYFAGYGFQLTDAIRATASRSRGFRAPTFNELFFPVFGNPNLKPEIADAVEAGLQYAMGRHFLRFAAYRTRYRDLINPFPIVNINEAQVKGAELSYAGQIADTNVRASLTFQNPRDVSTDQRLIRRASRLGSLTLTRAFGPFSLGGEVIAVGQRYDNDAFTDQRVSLPGYAIFNVIGRYNITKDVYVGVRAENIFDRDYTTAAGFNSQGALVLITLNYAPPR